jgi:hypothetical protein
MKPARIAIMYTETGSKEEFVRKCLQNECVETEAVLGFYWKIADNVCERVTGDGFY